MTESYQQDVTVHDPQYHTVLGITKTPEWYAMFGNHCPDCKQPAKFAAVEIETPKQKITAKANIKSKESK